MKAIINSRTMQRRHNLARLLEFLCLLLFGFLPMVTFSQSVDTVWVENWEAGIGSWSVNVGAWQAGVPTTTPPGKAHSGQNCAGTILVGDYPANIDSRLVSPQITLPGLAKNEVLQLRFWHWFNQYPEDSGFVEISLDDGANWTQISNIFIWNSNAWTQYLIDISDYANSTVRLAFHFTSNEDNKRAKGWYIDDILILKGVFMLSNDENFELGISSWYADNGVWEVGMPTSGPNTAHSAPNCAGTVLANVYPAYSNTRLISPQKRLVPEMGRTPQLYFWHWYNIFAEDFALLQISIEKGPWITISDTIRFNSDWTQYSVDLSPYMGSTVRFAFYFSSSASNQANGWYVDDIRFDGVVAVEDRMGRRADLLNSYTLHQNFPNPFNPETVILYELPQTSQVEVAIFNLLGERIRTLVNQRQTAGQHRLHWDGRNEFGMPVPSGVYLYRLRAGDFVQTRKMVLMQ